MTLDLESTDLAALFEQLRHSFDASAPSGFVRGRTAIRDAVVGRLGCSEAGAERLVETMIGRGFFRFQGNQAAIADGTEIWNIGTP